MTPLRKRMTEELQLRNFSEVTTKTYIRVVQRFAKHFGRSLEKLGAEQVRQYLLHLLNDKGDAWSTLQVNRAALKFLYVKVLKQPWFDEEIPKPKKRPRLPTVLSPEEITRMLDRTSNLKHWTVLATFYATGLRSRELRLLKVSDIDSARPRGRSDCRRFCSNDCAFTGGGASQRSGSSHRSRASETKLDFLREQA